MRTEKQESFIESYCQTGNATKAAIQAGYSQATAKQQGHVLKNKFAKEIEQRIKKMVQDAVPAAVSQISILAQTATSEQVRLNAAKEYWTGQVLNLLTGLSRESPMRINLWMN